MTGVVVSIAPHLLRCRGHWRPVVTLSRSAPSVSVMIVEDHDVMRIALSAAIDRLDGFAVAHCVGSAGDAISFLDHHDIDLALIDLSLPGVTGDQLVTEIAGHHPRTVCLILSGHREPGYVERAVDAGARGYVLKGYPDEIEPALRAVVAGDQYFSPALPMPDRGAGGPQRP